MGREFTMADGEKLFKSYGCTHFHMYRDEPNLHEEYVELNISKEQEREWTRDSFYDLIDSLSAPSTAAENLWWVHSRATTLAEYLREKEVIQTLNEASIELQKLLPSGDGIMCAENILDRRDISQKGSVIFISASLGLPELANNLIDRAEGFINHYNKADELRLTKVRERLERTRSILNNEAPNNRMLSDVAEPRC
jgi:hypothetical protein